MSGPTCRFCGAQCFVLRLIPGVSTGILLATCPEGMANDLEKTGYDHTTATNPQ